MAGNRVALAVEDKEAGGSGALVDGADEPVVFPLLGRLVDATGKML